MYQIQFGQLSNDKIMQIIINLSSKKYIASSDKQVLKQVTEIAKKRGII